MPPKVSSIRFASVALLVCIACGGQPARQVGGTIAGLRGTGLILQNNGGDDLAITADGAFVFAKKVPNASAYAVTVGQDPKGPSQDCTVANGSGSATADVTTVAVTCATKSFGISGTVSGLSGTGLVLQDNGGDDLPITANGQFAFSKPVASGTAFTVSVKTQPGSPAETCRVTGGAGTVGDGPVSSVLVNCTVNAYAVGGSVSGLRGSGLVLQDNAGDDLALSANGAFSFKSTILSGQAFDVTVKSQPTSPSQTCTVTSGSGSVSTGDVTTVVVACTTNTYVISGTITGLAGTGLTLQDNGGDNFNVPSGSTTFLFPTRVESGSPYAVTVLTQPNTPTQTCAFTAGTDTGTVVASDVSSVAIICTTNTYRVSGTVTGLTGTGLKLLDNGSDQLPVTGNGTFTFSKQVASGSAYEVTVATQPAGPSQTCTVSGGSGIIGGGDLTTVTVNCTVNNYAVGGHVANLLGTGLMLALNGGAGVAITGSSYSFPAIPSGTAYTVTIAAQPTSPWQTCSLANATGTVSGQDVGNVDVSCVSNPYTVGGSISGLTGSGLVIQDNGGNDTTLAAGATGFQFSTKVASGTAYAVTVRTQPSNPTQICSVSAGSGTMGGQDISNVAISCVTQTYNVGGTVSGLQGTLVLQDNGGDSKTINTNGTFTFATKVASASPYAVTVLTQPATPSQTCTVTNGSGPVVSSDITNVTVSCVTNSFFITGSISGLTGTGLALLDNGSDAITIPANATTFKFPTAITSGASYAVTIAQQPSSPTQSCTLTGATGTVGGSDVSSVAINCTTSSFAVGGVVSGLAGRGLKLVDNGSDTLGISGNGTYSFNTLVQSNSPYAVTIGAQPTGPWQTCAVSNGSGTVTNGPITNANVACTTNSYNLSVSVSGLSGSGLVVQNRGGDNLSVSVNGTFPFATKVASGATYNVTVLTQPSSPSQTCTVANASAVMAGADTTVAVTCSTNSYSVGGTVSGLTGTGLVLQDNGGDDLSIASSGTFTFGTKLTSGTAYAVTVKTNASGQNCTVSSGTGTVTTAAVTSVAVSCSAQTINIPGPALTNNIGSWTNPGIQVTALGNLTLTSFTFQNQGGADTVQLTDSAGTVLASISVPAGNPSYKVNVSWALAAGQTYRIFGLGQSNGKWANYTSWPTTSGNLRVDGTWGNNALQTSWWFSIEGLTGY